MNLSNVIAASSDLASGESQDASGVVAHARKILALDGFEAEPHALPMRVEHMWRGENFSPVVPYVGSVLIPLGPVSDIGVLRESIASVVGRHESLRSRLALRNGRAVQLPQQAETPELELVNVSHSDIAGYRGSAAPSAITEFFGTPINLFEQTGFRCRAFRDENNSVALGILLHHYFGDAWSSQILRREIETVYSAGTKRQAAELSPVAQYGEYALHQRRTLDKNLAAQLRYWDPRIRNAPPSMPPFDRCDDEPALGRLFFLVETPLMTRLVTVSQAQRTSLALLCFAAYQLAIAGWCGQDEVVTAVHTADRIRPQFRNTIGYLMAGLPITSQIFPSMGLPEFLSTLARDFYTAMAHQNLAFEFHQEIFAPPPPFCTMRYNFIPRQQSYFLGDNEASLPSFSGVQSAPGIRATVAYRDMYFLLIEYPQGLLARVNYNTNLSFETMVLLVERYKRILERMAGNPEGRLSDII